MYLLLVKIKLLKYERKSTSNDSKIMDLSVINNPPCSDSFVDDDGNYIIADPNSVSNSTQTYTYEELKRETNNTASAAWAFRKD